MIGELEVIHDEGSIVRV